MIHELKDTPNTMVAFEAVNEITIEDFDKIVLPAIAELVQRTDKLNFLLVLETPIKNFAIGPWLSQAMAGLNNTNKWNRAAVITDSSLTHFYTDHFSKVMPGEFRGYEHSQLNEAIEWVGEQPSLGKTEVFQQEGTTKD